jgi:hypothetical protein
VHFCDAQGRSGGGYSREVLCSAVSPVASIIAKFQTDTSKARLWNFDPKAAGDWRGQRVLTPELSLQEAGLRNDQGLLLEVSLADGSWPKSQLHAQLGKSS